MEPTGEKTTLREGRNDEKRFYVCNQPHADQTAAQAALLAFIADVEVARLKNNIANVAFVVKDSAWHGDEIGSFVVPGFFGNLLEEEGMLAFALGQASAERQARIAKMLSANSITKPKKSR